MLLLRLPLTLNFHTFSITFKLIMKINSFLLPINFAVSAAFPFLLGDWPPQERLRPHFVGVHVYLEDPVLLLGMHDRGI